MSAGRPRSSRALTWSSSLGCLGLSLGISAGACAVPSAFACQSDAQCGSEGECVSGSCAFPDDECDSGLRYGTFAAPSLAGDCVEPEVAEGSGTGESGTSESGSSTEESESESSGLESETETTGPPLDLVPDGPPIVLGYYTFDQGTIEDELVMEAEGGLEAKLVGPSIMPFDGGVNDQCLTLEGNSWLELAPELLAGRQTFTVEFYLRTDPQTVAGSRDTLFYFGDAVEHVAAPRMWAVLEFIDSPPNSVRWKWTTVMGTETALEGTSDVVTEPAWVHIALIAGPAGTELWVNHELEAVDPIAPDVPDSGEEAILVGSFPDGLNDFTGAIDELRVSDRPLTTEEMLPLPMMP